MTEKQIFSPIPGVFYRKPSPTDEPYSKPGDRLEEETIIGLVEVMKSFFEIKAESPGILVTFLIENEEIVEAGQPVAVISIP